MCRILMALPLAAQYSDQDRVVATILVGCLIVIALVIAGAIVAMWAKRRTAAPPAAAPAGGLSLSQIRELRRVGKMTQEEFERVRARIVADTLASQDHPTDRASARPKGNDATDDAR